MSAIEEIAKRAKMSVSETRRVLKISRHPISLDRPVGESEDSYFGDFIEDEKHSIEGRRIFVALLFLLS